MYSRLSKFALWWAQNEGVSGHAGSEDDSLWCSSRESTLGFTSEHISKDPCKRETDVHLKGVIYLVKYLGSINKLYYLSWEIKY